MLIEHLPNEIYSDKLENTHKPCAATLNRLMMSGVNNKQMRIENKHTEQVLFLLLLFPLQDSCCSAVRAVMWPCYQRGFLEFSSVSNYRSTFPSPLILYLEQLKDENSSMYNNLTKYFFSHFDITLIEYRSKKIICSYVGIYSAGLIYSSGNFL